MTQTQTELAEKLRIAELERLKSAESLKQARQDLAESASMLRQAEREAETLRRDLDALESAHGAFAGILAETADHAAQAARREASLSKSSARLLTEWSSEIEAREAVVQTLLDEISELKSRRASRLADAWSRERGLRRLDAVWRVAFGPAETVPAREHGALDADPRLMKNIARVASASEIAILERKIETLFGPHERKAQVEALVALSQACAEIDPRRARSLAERAVRRDPNPRRRKWLAFRYARSGAPRTARWMLATLPADIPMSASERRQAQHLRTQADKTGAPPTVRHATAEPGVFHLVPPSARSVREPLKPAMDAYFTDLAARRGAAFLREWLPRQMDGHDPDVRAYCLARAARVLADTGAPAEAAALAGEAYETSRSPTISRAAARVYYHTADFEKAEVIIASLAERAGGGLPADQVLLDEAGGYAELARRCAAPPAAAAAPDPENRRVLNVLAFSLPWSSVGYATRSHGLAKAIRARGWELEGWTRPGFPADTAEGPPEDFAPGRVEIDGVPYVSGLDVMRRGVKEPDYLRDAVGYLDQAVSKMEPGIVHAASNYATALPALLAARRAGLPFIYEVRGFWEITRASRDADFARSRRYNHMQALESAVALNADHVITITGGMRDELIDRGVPAAKVSVAPNSVDIEAFSPREPDLALKRELGFADAAPVIGYVGSLLDYEGLDDLIRACAMLGDREFGLLIVGDGPMRERLERQAAEAGLGDRAVFTGRVPHETVGSYYSLIDIAPFPRKPWEVCELVSPLKPFEAMALNRAVVASSTRALSEIVRDGRTGRLFEKGSAKALAGVLGELLDDPAQRTALAAAGREWVAAERSWAKAAQTVESIYDALLKGRGA
jgi:glycosyltransferase involved in cell wall biosynthesis